MPYISSSPLSTWSGGRPPVIDIHPYNPRNILNASPVGQPIPILIGTHKFQGQVIWGRPPFFTGFDDEDWIGWGYIQTGGSVWGSAAYLFFHNYFDLSTKIIQAKFDDVVVVRNGRKVGDFQGRIAFHAGTRSQIPDGFIWRNAGEGLANTPAYRGYAYLTAGNLDLEKYQDGLPICFGIVTNSFATGTTETEFENLDFHDDLITNGYSTVSFNVDWSLEKLYSSLQDTEFAVGGPYICTYDIPSLTEISCVQLQNPPVSFQYIQYLYPVPGTGAMFCEAHTADNIDWIMVIDPETGEIFDSLNFGGDFDEFLLTGSFLTAQGIRYWMAGQHNEGLYIYLFNPGTNVLALLGGTILSGTPFAMIVEGPAESGSKTIFFGSRDDGVYEVTFNATEVTTRLIYNPAGNVSGFVYDATDKALVVSLDNGTAVKVSLNTLAVLDTFTIPNNTGFKQRDDTGDLDDRFTRFLKRVEGFATLVGPLSANMTSQGPGENWYLFNLAEGTYEALGNPEKLSSAIETEAGYSIYLDAEPNEIWRIVPFATYSGVDVTLENVLTLLMRFQGYAESSISFHGFSADLTLHAVIIQTDTNTSELVSGLCALYGVLIVESGTGIKFVIPPKDDDFDTDFELDLDNGLSEQKNGEVIEFLPSGIRVEHEIPYIVELEHIDPDADYQPTITVSEMPTVPVSTIQSNKKERISLPISLTSNEAKKRIVEYHYRQAIGRQVHKLKVPSDWVHLEPGDVGVITVEGRDYTVLLLRAQVDTEDFCITFDCADYLSSTESDHSTQTPDPFEPVEDINQHAIYIHLDTALLHRSHDRPGSLMQYHVVASRAVGTTWRGATLYRAPANDPNIEFVAQWNGRTPVYGLVREEVSMTNYEGVLSVKLQGGRVTNLVTLDDAIVSRNIAAWGRPGRWELVYFNNPSDQGGDVYQIDIVQRGLRGTDIFMDDHVIGDLFVLLRNNVGALIYDDSELDDQYQFFPVPSGKNFQQVAPTSGTITGAAEKPYAPIVTATFDDYSNSIFIDAIRGSRLEGIYGNDTELSETVERYRIRLMDEDDNLLSTLTVVLAVPEYEITEAQILAAYGSFPNTVYLRMDQWSDTVGWGYSRFVEVDTSGEVGNLFAVVPFSSPGATGDQDITDAATFDGTVPKMAIFIWGYNGIDNAAVNGACIGIGFGYPTVMGNARNNSTHQRLRTSSTTNGLVFGNPSTSSIYGVDNSSTTTLESRATVTAMIANGVRITWGEINPSLKGIAILLGGADMQAFSQSAASLSISTTILGTSENFSADIVLMSSIFSSTNAANSVPRMSVGACLADLTQRCLAFAARQTSTFGYWVKAIPDKVLTQLSDVDGSEVRDTTVTDIDSGTNMGFRMTASSGFNGDISTLHLAGVQAAVEWIDSPTSIGTQAYTGFGFEPKLIIVFATMLTALDTLSTGGADRESFSWGAATSDAERSHGVSQNNSATFGSMSSNSDKVIRIVAPDGTTEYLEASLVSFDADGFTLDFTAVQITARKIMVIALR